MQLARHTLKGIWKIEMARKTYPKRYLEDQKRSQDIPQKISSKVEIARKTKFKGYTGRSNQISEYALIEMRGVEVDRKQFPKGYQEPTCIRGDWVWRGRQRRVTFVEFMRMHE